MKAYVIASALVLSLIVVPLYPTTVRPVFGGSFLTLLPSPIPVLVKPGTESDSILTIASANGAPGPGGPCSSSITGFSLHVTVSPVVVGAPSVTLNPNCVNLDYNGKATVLMAVIAASTTPVGNYTADIGALFTPCPLCATMGDDVGSVPIIVTNSINSLKVDNVSFLLGTRSTIEGSVFTSLSGTTLYGTITVTTQNMSTGVVLFNNLFTITTPLNNQTARFIMNVPVGTETLAATCVVNTGTLAEFSFITRTPAIDGRTTVDIVDAGVVYAAFGSTTGSARYQAAADLDANGKIDIVDAGMISADFGLTLVT